MVSINKEIAEKPQNNDTEVVLSVNGVSKRFCRDLKTSLFYGVQDIAAEVLGLRGSSDKLRNKEFWAVNDVSFELRRGEALGLVGKNGSGKSTLLRIIAGLIKPDAGTVEVNGRVAPLIALGAGFNPILTGRENIYANMSILGLSKKEIDERFDEVLEFAEIGDAIDSPVRSYSSGMAARLGFASAIHTEPDILLIDEVLAVGDVKFRAKCHRKLHELRKKGTSFILVSHNHHEILNVCDSAAYLLKGNLIASGDTATVMNQYENELFITGMPTNSGKLFLPEKSQTDSVGLDISYLFFRDNEDNILDSIISGEYTKFCVGVFAHKIFSNISLFLMIQEVSGDNNVVLHLSSFYDNEPFDVSQGKHEIQVKMPFLGLNPGLYTMRLSIKEGSLSTLDTVESFRFTVSSKATVNRGIFFQARKWDIVEKYD